MSLFLIWLWGNSSLALITWKVVLRQELLHAFHEGLHGLACIPRLHGLPRISREIGKDIHQGLCASAF